MKDLLHEIALGLGSSHSSTPVVREACHAAHEASGAEAAGLCLRLLRFLAIRPPFVDFLCFLYILLAVRGPRLAGTARRCGAVESRRRRRAVGAAGAVGGDCSCVCATAGCRCRGVRQRSRQEDSVLDGLSAH